MQKAAATELRGEMVDEVAVNLGGPSSRALIGGCA